MWCKLRPKISTPVDIVRLEERLPLEWIVPSSFLLRERLTDTILFLGVVSDPTA